MRVRLIPIILFCFIFSLSAQNKRVKDKKDYRLVLSINVDQLRSDFLFEFEGLYSDGGFKRLLSQGKVYSNAYYAFEHIEYLDDTTLFDDHNIEDMTEEIYPGVRRIKSKKL